MLRGRSSQVFWSVTIARYNKRKPINSAWVNFMWQSWAYVSYQLKWRYLLSQKHWEKFQLKIGEVLPGFLGTFALWNRPLVPWLGSDIFYLQCKIANQVQDCFDLHFQPTSNAIIQFRPQLFFKIPRVEPGAAAFLSANATSVLCCSLQASTSCLESLTRNCRS